MIRIYLSIAFAVSMLGLDLGTGEACSCAEQTPKQYVDGADQVLVAKAHADKQTANGYVQTFDVLYAIKGQNGKTGKTFTWTRTEANPLCGPAYTDGELAILFVTKGDLGLCSGNFGIAAQAPHVAAYVVAAGVKGRAVSLAAMKATLAAGLAKYLHGRAVVPVHYPALAGKSFKLGKSKLAFQAAKPRGKNAISIDESFELGPLVYVRGHYPIEGYAFDVVAVAAPGKDPVVVHVAGVER